MSFLGGHQACGVSRLAKGCGFRGAKGESVGRQSGLLRRARKTRFGFGPQMRTQCVFRRTPARGRQGLARAAENAFERAQTLLSIGEIELEQLVLLFLLDGALQPAGLSGKVFRG